MELKRLGKYEIVAKIGEGGMGEVHRAHDPVLNRDVAIKTLAAGGDAAGDLRKRFHREAQSAAGLNHPNIVTVHDFGEEHGYMYIAMELLEGRDLREVIKRKRPMSLEAKLDLMDQICDGVAFAHARDVIHRDLKPANIHLLPNGRAKIMDFGLARISSASDLTGAGIMLGTPNYMSPEQVRGDKSTTRSDVFSLGVVFYELMCGRKAFEADTLAGVLLQVVQVEPRTLDQLRAEVPVPVARVVQRAMAKDPASRFAHAGELREALREARPALRAEARLQEQPRWPARPDDTLSGVATLTRPVEAPRSTAASMPVTAPRHAPHEATPVPAKTRQPEAIGTLTVPAAGAETVVTPAALPIVEPMPVPPTALVPGPVRARPGTAPTVLVRTALGLLGVGVVVSVVLRRDGNISPADQPVAQPPPSAAAPLTTTAPPSPVPSAPAAAPPVEAPVPHLAEAERSLRERDYRAALRMSESVLAEDPGSEPARRLAERARRALRDSDGTAARLRKALEAHDVEKASLALSELLAQDPRRPDAPVLAARLNEAMTRRRAKDAAQPSMPGPVIAVATPLPAPPTTAPIPAAPLPSAPATALPALQSEAAARQAIRGVLDEYRAAFERRDAEALRAVQPGVDYEKMRDRFASVTGYTVRIDVKDVAVEGDQGTATCIVTYMPQPKPSQKIPPQRTLFHLRRTGDVWLIERLEAK